MAFANRHLQERRILTNTSGSIRDRIAQVYVEIDEIWIVDMLDKRSLPVRVSIKSYVQVCESEVLLPEFRNPNTSVPKVTAKMRERSQKMYAVLKQALLDEPRIFTNEGRSYWFKELKKELAPDLSYKTFMKYLRLWFHCGKSPDGLLPNWDKCAVNMPVDLSEISKINFTEAKEWMRAASASISIPYDVDADHKRNFTYFRVDRHGAGYVAAVFIRYYKKHITNGQKRLSGLFHDMLNDVYGSKTPLDKIVLPDYRTIPSLPQFYRVYKKLFSYSDRRAAKVGKKRYDLNEREVLGTSLDKIPFAGLQAEIDATIWNVEIVSRFTGRRTIGPVIVFRIRDTNTGMCLGLSVSLENASWMGAASAIANCFEDKVEFCKRFGIEISADDWPVIGITAQILADRGETDGFGPEPFTRRTGTVVIQVQALRGDQKGGIESDFNTHQVTMNGETPGQILSRWVSQGNTTWRTAPALDIEQFTAKLIRHELQRMKTIRKKTPLTAAMIAAGTDSSPLSMWNYEVEYRGSRLKYFDLEDIQLSLMPRAVASTTEHGLSFKECLYSAPELVRDGDFAKARMRGRSRLDIAYDPRLADFIYLIVDKDSDVYIKATLLDIPGQSEYMGKTFREIAELKRQHAANNSKDVQKKMESVVNFRAQEHQARKTAIEMTKAQQDPNESQTSKIRNKPSARKSELYETSPGNAFRPMQTLTTETESNDSEPAVTSPAANASVETADVRAVAAAQGLANRRAALIKPRNLP